MFNGCQEFDVKPKPLTTTKILQKTRNINYVYGKKKSKYSACETPRKSKFSEKGKNGNFGQNPKFF